MSTTVYDYPTVEQVESCENVRQCLGWNRFLPGPKTDEQVDVINAVVKRLRELRARDNDAYVAASKSLGWGLT